MDCANLLQTQAFIDGELSGPGINAAEQHIAGCAECQGFCENAATLSNEICRYAQRYPAPDRLKLRVLEAVSEADAALADPAAGQSVRDRRRAPSWRGALSRSAGRLWSRWSHGGVMGGFFGGMGVSGLAAALIALAVLPPTPDTLADRIVRAHTEALMSGHAIQVVSSDHHTVKPWFAGRIDISPPVHDFAAEGFKLVGGRIDTIAGRRAAVLVYEHGLHKIDLFVWADHGERLPGAGTRRGYNALCWNKEDLDFAAVSDMQASELATFSNLIRSTQE
ncbi:MAG: zf-HC2 domain-containing protein [Pseudomonadota bacterium]|nr:zf-HC2 domain-containing protein [Pseudomonadota bacterium]